MLRHRKRSSFVEIPGTMVGCSNGSIARIREIENQRSFLKIQQRSSILTERAATVKNAPLANVR